MNKALPWNVNGIGFEAREAAHLAARRAGKPVGEWLNSVIAEHASGIGVTAESFSSNDRLDSLVARLAGVAESLGAAEDREHGRNDAIRRPTTPNGFQSTASVAKSTREEQLLSDQETSFPPDHSRRSGEGQSGSRGRDYLSQWDNDVLLDEALELIEKRTNVKRERRAEQQRVTVAALAGEADAPTVHDSDYAAGPGRFRSARAGNARRERRPLRDAVGVVADRIEDIENRITQRDADLATRPIVAALGRLEDRFEHLIRRNQDGGRETARFETGMQDLDSRLRSLAERIDRNDAGRARSDAGRSTRDPGPASFRSRDEADDLHSPGRAGGRHRDTVAEIAQRQRDLDAGQGRRSSLLRSTSHSSIDQAQRDAVPAELGAFATLQDAFADLTERLEARLDAQARAASLDDRSADIGALKSGIAELGERLETMRKRDDDERVRVGQTDARSIDMLRQEMGTLQQVLTELAPQSAIATLESAVRELGDQLDASRRMGVNPSVLAPIEALQEDVRAALQDDSLRAKVGHVEEQLGTIASRMERIETRGISPELMQSINGQIRDLHGLLGGAAIQFQTVERIENEVAQLTARVERLLETPPRGAVRDLELAVNEIRTLLVQFSPETVLYDVQRQLDGLSDQIGSLRQSVVAPGAMIEEFGRRIEDAHNALAERLLKAVPAVDLSGIEASIGGLAGRIDGLRTSSSDMQALGGLVRGLAAQIEEARLPNADAKVIDTLENQVSRLAERLDRSDASLDAIGSVERLIRELFTQIDDTRASAIEAAESAARMAAKETLRAALVNPAIVGEEASARASRVVEQVGQEISEFRRVQQVSEKRVHSTLMALNETLERMVDRMVVDAEPPVDPARGPDAPAAVRESAEAPTVRKLPSAADAVVPPVAVSLPVAAEPVAPEASREPPPVKASAPAVEVGRAPQAEPMPDVSPLIAAARRAAMSAQASANAAGKDAAPKTRVAAPQTAAAGKGWRSALRQKRQPILMSVAAVVLMLGALQIVRLTETGQRFAGKPDQVARSSGTDGVDSAAITGSIAPAPTSTAKADLAPTQTVAPSPSVAPAAPPPSTAALEPAPKAFPAGLRDLADKGDAAAQYEVGARLAEGRGIARDPGLASTWFDRAAKQNLAPAEYRLGSLYEKGIGVAASPAQAIGWYEKAANQGNVRAMHNLAVMAAEGSAGKADYARAASWFTKAAEHGVRDSQYNLAILYARGLGVPQDLGQSYTWFSIAAAQGDADAGKKRDDVAAKMDAAKVATAKTAADAFKPQPVDKAANDVTPPPGGWDVAASAKAPAPPKISSM